MVSHLQTEPSGDISQAFKQDLRRKPSNRSLRKLFFTAVILGVLNLALFVIGTFYLGGNAIKGKIEAGKYYVWGYHRGIKGYAEVSHTCFVYSEWHGKSVIVTWPFMILACFIYERTKKR